MCTVLLPPGDNPIAVNKYIISNAKFNGVFSALNLILNKLTLLWIKHIRMSLLCLWLSIVLFTTEASKTERDFSGLSFSLILPFTYSIPCLLERLRWKRIHSCPWYSINGWTLCPFSMKFGMAVILSNSCSLLWSVVIMPTLSAFTRFGFQYRTEHNHVHCWLQRSSMTHCRYASSYG
jgi:hypothetical protein